MSRITSLLFNIAALAILASALFFFTRPELRAHVPAEQSTTTSVISQTAGAVSSSPVVSVPTTSAATSSPPSKKQPAKKVPTASATPLSHATDVSSASLPDTNQATRIQDPYPFAPYTFPTINNMTRGALVNILCIAKGQNIHSITGSGVVIDPRGVILTNAHVAQYVLLSQSPKINLICVIRTGSPAIARWRAEILYIPPVWVNAHAADITSSYTTGTGEHDYALLRIVGTLDGSPLTGSFPFLAVDTRDAIGFQGDQVLAASYPAEFSTGSQQDNVYAASTVASIQQLLTFDMRSVDLVSLGGIIEAQSGSSGGAVVNAWGRLIGIIVTTSEGKTTGERDLHALTLSYINNDIAKQTGHTLSEILASDVVAVAADFNEKVSPNLIAKYLEQFQR